MDRLTCGTNQAFRRYIAPISTDTSEVIRLCELLLERERAEVADFARVLPARPGATPDAGRQVLVLQSLPRADKLWSTKTWHPDETRKRPRL